MKFRENRLKVHEFCEVFHYKPLILINSYKTWSWLCARVLDSNLYTLESVSITVAVIVREKKHFSNSGGETELKTLREIGRKGP